MNRFMARDRINFDENINIYTYTAYKDEALHTHDFLEIVYVQSGTGRHCVGGTWYPVERGNILFINLGQTHAFCSNGQMQLTNILLMPEFIDGGLIDADNAFGMLALSAFSELKIDNESFMPAIALDGREIMEMERLLVDMQSEFSGKLPNYKTALKGYVYILFTRLFRAMQREQGDVVGHVGKVVLEVLEYIEQNYDQKLSLQGLAERCFYSASYFSRVFKQSFGKTLTEHINELRIEKAAQLLTSTELNVTEICGKVGFRDRKQFYRLFRELTGQSPTEYRKAK